MRVVFQKTGARRCLAVQMHAVATQAAIVGQRLESETAQAGPLRARRDRQFDPRTGGQQQVVADLNTLQAQGFKGDVVSRRVADLQLRRARSVMRHRPVQPLGGLGRIARQPDGSVKHVDALTYGDRELAPAGLMPRDFKHRQVQQGLPVLGHSGPLVQHTHGLSAARTDTRKGWRHHKGQNPGRCR